MMIFDILSLPATLFLDMCEKIKEMADEEMLLTMDSIKKKFMEIQMDYEEGKITQEEYTNKVEFLSNRLEEVLQTAENRSVNKK